MGRMVTGSGVAAAVTLLSWSFAMNLIARLIIDSANKIAGRRFCLVAVIHRAATTRRDLATLQFLSHDGCSGLVFAYRPTVTRRRPFDLSADWHARRLHPDNRTQSPQHGKDRAMQQDAATCARVNGQSHQNADVRILFLIRYQDFGPA